MCAQRNKRTSTNSSMNFIFVWNRQQTILAWWVYVNCVDYCGQWHNSAVMPFLCVGRDKETGRCCTSPPQAHRSEMVHGIQEAECELWRIHNQRAYASLAENAARTKNGARNTITRCHCLFRVGRVENLFAWAWRAMKTTSTTRRSQWMKSNAIGTSAMNFHKFPNAFSATVDLIEAETKSMRRPPQMRIIIIDVRLYLIDWHL